MYKKEENNMANIYQGTIGLIGNTPLVEVVNIACQNGNDVLFENFSVLLTVQQLQLL